MYAGDSRVRIVVFRAPELIEELVQIVNALLANDVCAVPNAGLVQHGAETVNGAPPPPPILLHE